MKKLLFGIAVAAGLSAFAAPSAIYWNMDGYAEFTTAQYATLFASIDGGEQTGADWTILPDTFAGRNKATVGDFGGESYSYYVQIFNEAHEAIAESAVLTWDDLLAADAVSVTMTHAGAGTATFGGFTAVPEPTSALLMLLGMAGLALKRKHA